MAQFVQQSQLPTCQICRQAPVPQSTQLLIFSLFQILLVFLNIKLAVIVLMIGYSFSYIEWKCPVCSRQVNVPTTHPHIQANIIIRMGKCMGILSKTKFRILAFILCILMLYFIISQPIFQHKVKIQKTWESIAQNCGYSMYLQNSFRANYLYEKYIESGNDWILEGIYLGEQDKPGLLKDLKIKMNPTQFADPITEDFIALVPKNQLNSIKLEYQDKVRLYGEWEGRLFHKIIFVAFKIENLGKGSLNDIKQFRTQSLRLQNV